MATIKLSNACNSDVIINKFFDKYCGIEINENSNVFLEGTLVDLLEINNIGNGNVETKANSSKKVDTQKKGNGDVTIKSDNDYNFEMAGNGDIVNCGKVNAIKTKR